MIKMFIGSSSKGEDADIEMAYEYSLRENCSEELTIEWMRQSDDPNSYWGCWQTHTWPTPFSGFRWGIAEFCNFEGRAIYTDCDMINFKDMVDLFTVDMYNKPIAARKGQRFGGHEFCVMVFDCERIQDMLIPITRQKNIPEYHHRMIHKFSGNNELVEDLDPRWNCLDGETLELEEIFQLHFTNMSTQPWTPEWYTGEISTHPRRDILEVYFELLEEASSNGFQPSEYKKIVDK